MEKVSELMRKAGCDGLHRCGSCYYWRTDQMIDGEFCGWVGTCCNPDSPVDRFIEADDRCKLFTEIGAETDEAENA